MSEQNIKKAISNISLDLEIRSLKASKTSEAKETLRNPEFSVDVNLEETVRKQGEVILKFQLVVSTEPAAAKFEIEGVVKIKGDNKAINEVITENEKTHVPLVISEIYSRTYSMFYILASGIGIQYPGAGLLYADTTILRKEISPKKESSEDGEQKKAEESDSEKEA